MHYKVNQLFLIIAAISVVFLVHSVDLSSIKHEHSKSSKKVNSWTDLHHMTLLLRSSQKHLNPQI